MRARDLYGRYRDLLFGLARNAQADPDWSRTLQAIIRAFELDAESLDADDAVLLREELCEQLEQAANGATNAIARAVLRAGLKKIELIS